MGSTLSRIDPLVLGVGLLALGGVLVAFRGGARTGSKLARQSREVSRMGAVLTRALLLGGVIAGVQWAVITYSTDRLAWAVVLAVPAVFAGAGLARVFVVTSVVHGHDGRERGSRR